MVPQTRVLLVGLACLASSACGGDIDLVAESAAEEEDDAPAEFRDVMTAEPCEAGEYRGSFKANRGIDLGGKIIVAMTRSTSGEFRTLDRSSTLQTPPLSTGATVTATVVGDGSCTTGDFVAKIEEGRYVLPDEGQSEILFTGDVRGSYRVTSRGPAFVGEWAAFLATSPPDQPISAGTWMAVLGMEAAAE